MAEIAGYLSFQHCDNPIDGPVTKFGGAPNWLTTPEWPIDTRNGQPMMFLGQVFLDPEIFGVLKGRMAYLFFPRPIHYGPYPITTLRETPSLSSLANQMACKPNRSRKVRQFVES